MNRLLSILFCFTLCLTGSIAPSSAHAAEDEFVARELIALYDSRYETNLRGNTIHRFLGMPANRLGYTIRYHDINTPLPDLGDNVHGILIWFHHSPIPNVQNYIAWLAEQLRKGKRLVVMEGLGIGREDVLTNADLARIKYIYERLGVRDNGVWHPLTYKSRILSRNPDVVDFERRLTPPLAPFGQLAATPAGTSHMRIAIGDEAPGTYADVIITGPQGGFAASGYVYHEQEVNEHTISAWYLNPFNFLTLALTPLPYPIPDVTTRNGRRIFYSHIDGDGWNNRTHIEDYDHAFSSRVILEEILKPNQDFGFSVGIVAGDMTEDCFGSERSRQVAIEALALDNVEAASHTYTHPLYWQYFEDYTAQKEREFANNFPKPAGMFSQDYEAMFSKDAVHRHDSHTPPSIEEMKKSPLSDNSPEAQKRELLAMYNVPRSYNCMEFDEENEIQGANAVIESLAPAGKKVTLMQWSGNTSPYERFLRKTREAGMYNINGGESRYDAEYPSYSTLYPIGIQMGDELQIYSTASNENTYTNLWSERFFGYRYLIETVRHTETPIRLAPFNVYFHSYSGERPGSLRALQEIMTYARKHELIPLLTSTYAAIANGFYTTRIEPLGHLRWRIHNRGELQTVRFPAPLSPTQGTLAVDMIRSTGVIGQRMLQENLYIFLNPSIDKPEVLLINTPPEATPERFSLISSRWDILSVSKQTETEVLLTAQGYGKGEMQWHVPQNGTYKAIATHASGKEASYIAASENNVLKLVIENAKAHSPVDIAITLQEEAAR